MGLRLGMVIPILKTEPRWVLELCESLDGELGPEDRVLWIDDGSPVTDGLDAAEARFRRDSRHAFVRAGQNRGIPATFNRGIRELDVDLVVTMGSDDMLSRGYLSRAREMFERDPDLEIVVPAMELFGGQTGVHDPGPNPFRLHRILRGNRIPAASMFRKRLFDGLGGFDESLTRNNFEDWDFWMRARIARAPFARLEAVGYRYRVSGDSASRKIAYEAARRRLWSKWLVPLLLSPFRRRTPWRS